MILKCFLCGKIIRRSFQSRSRDRPNRFGGGNKNAPFSENINGPTVNGKYLFVNWSQEKL